jgi:hypothetical protein
MPTLSGWLYGSNMTKFNYGQILLDDTIRLVQINDSSPPENISLSIDNFPLATLPKYHALSYTWGPPCPGDNPYTKFDKVEILLNGCNFSVFPNLAAALARIRIAKRSKYYWIDALCINQNNVREREAQVLLMDKVFKLADHVDVWIGSPGHAAAEVAEMISKMATLSPEIVEEAYLSRPRPIQTALEPEFLQALGLPAMTGSAWTALVEFFERRWFSRVWILQEIAMARGATILWGDQNIPWDDISASTRHLGRKTFGRALVALKLGSLPDHTFSWTVGTLPGVISNIRRLCQDAKWAELEMSSIVQNMLTAYFLIQLLHLSRGFEATDGRDKIFALLGILTHYFNDLPPLELQPNYSKESTIAKLFTRVTTHIINAMGINYLSILTMVSDISLTAIAGLPSWVPDFTVSRLNLILDIRHILEPTEIEASGGESWGKKSVEIRNFQELHCKNLRVGCIVAKSEAGFDYTMGQVEELAGILLQCSEVYAPTGESRMEVMWRTIILDVYKSKVPAPSYLGESFRHWMAHCVMQGVIRRLQDDSDLDSYILQKMQNIRGLLRSDRTGTMQIVEALMYDGWRSHQPHEDDDISTRLKGCLSFMADIKNKRICRLGDDDGFEMRQKNFINALGELEARKEEYQTAVFTAVPYRRLFLTDTGYLGMGPQSLEVGDEVSVVLGCPSPLVLRQRDPPNTMQSEQGLQGGPTSAAAPSIQYRRLLGEAYVHGAMRGEVVNHGSSWEPVCIL